MKAIQISGVSCLLCCSAASASEPNPDLFDLSIEQLLALKVELVSRRPEPLQDIPSAISIITAEDIRRSGASTLPEILRLVPGVYVTRLDSSKWAVSIRGFHSRLANKLLVMMDGRTLYSPLFSGVYWELQDTYLPDIERIEVVRGPGGSLWGSNAVNGIINIVTRRSDDTVGLSVEASVGDNALEHRLGVRYGVDSSIGPVRFYLQETHHDGGLWPGQEYGNQNYFPEDTDAFDNWQRTIAGFRHDGHDGDRRWRIQGSVFDGEFRQIRVARLSPSSPLIALPDTVIADGHALQGHYSAPAASGRFELSAFVDHSKRADASFDETRDTVDLDMQYQGHFDYTFSHEWTAGIGFRRSDDRAQGLTSFVLLPQSSTEDTYSAFVNDQISVIPNRVLIALGVKFEHNNFTDWEHQPNIRLTWLPAPGRTLWAALSNSVRLPSRSERDAYLRLPDDSLLQLGNPDLASEKMRAAELGWREQWTSLSSDITAFRQHYAKLISNTANGTETLDIDGVEWELRWKPADSLDLTAYSAWYTDERRADGLTPLVLKRAGHLRLYWKATGPFNLSATYTRNGHLRTTNSGVTFGNFDVLDIGAHWSALKGEWSLIGHNLINSERIEERDTTRLSTLTERSVELRYHFEF